MKQSIMIFLACVIVSGCCVSTTETAPIQHEIETPTQMYIYRHHDYIQF